MLSWVVNGFGGSTNLYLCNVFLGLACLQKISLCHDSKRIENSCFSGFQFVQCFARRFFFRFCCCVFSLKNYLEYFYHGSLTHSIIFHGKRAKKKRETALIVKFLFLQVSIPFRQSLFFSLCRYQSSFVLFCCEGCY